MNPLQSFIKTEKKSTCSSCYYRRLIYAYAKHQFKLLYFKKQPKSIHRVSLLPLRPSAVGMLLGL